MRFLQTEIILKGIYLGLLLFVALQEPDWSGVGLVAGCTFGGLFIALGIAAVRTLREGYQVRGRLPAFILFLLLESPSAVYAGILLGMALGAQLVRRPDTPGIAFVGVAGAGALLGVAFGFLRQVRNNWVRLGGSLVIAAVLVTAALAWLGQLGEYGRQVVPANLDRFGLQLLLGIPAFYLLTFAGREEESEVEIGAMCAAAAVGVFLLTQDQRNLQSVTLIVAMMLYFFYTTRILPGLRVFKHSLRGLSYSRIGRYRPALLSFRRALELDPANALAREGMWGVHRVMDLGQLVNDQKTLALIDFELCLERVATLLLAPAPTPEKLDEANRLLDLVLNQRPTLRPAVLYWRAVAATHAKQYEAAAADLAALLDPTAFPPPDAARNGVLFQAWQLALVLHPELKRRAGVPQLALPGRRMEAIATVERRLAEAPDDAGAWDLKRLLYSELSEAEYDAAVGKDQAAAEFDHDYAQQLGLALVEDAGRWRRGAEFLLLAARGLPAQGPSLYSQIAQAHEKAGDAAGALANYERAVKAGQAAGPKQLPDAERQTYFAAVKLLAERAQARGDTRAAIDYYHLYLESERSGVETLRTLAALYEQRGNPLAALRMTEEALIYNGKDKDLLERKDRYYYSVIPDDLRARLELVRPAFDVDYCVRKAKSLIDGRDLDLDLLDWAQHLAQLSLIARPESLPAKVLVARSKLRRGEKDEAVALLESVRNPRPEKFASSDDEEAWYLASRLLGEMYLNELAKPDQAVLCFNDYRNSSKSGADTVYKLGLAYEQLGDMKRAKKCYELVTAYDGHPLASEARDALDRVQSQGRSLS